MKSRKNQEEERGEEENKAIWLHSYFLISAWIKWIRNQLWNYTHFRHPTSW